MNRIRCKNCGQEVMVTPNQRCSNCNIKWWGYQSEANLPANAGMHQRKAPLQPPIPTNTKPSVVGWLIVHTEGKAHLSFPLNKAQYRIGRKSFGEPNEIIIQDDEYVSRKHAILIVSDNMVKIQDVGSRNGILINGNPSKINLKVDYPLEEDDTLQIGETKLILKFSSKNNLAQAIDAVRKMKYIPTIKHQQHK